MRLICLSTIVLTVCFAVLPVCHAHEVLYEDTFDNGLSAKWQVVGLDPDDYRVRGGALELRLTPTKAEQPQPMLKVNLPFSTADSVVASVEVRVVDTPLNPGDFAGLCLTDRDGPVFTGRKTNVDGYFVFAPGEVDFIGAPGQEGDPGQYTVKYWPAGDPFGPLRIVVRGHYAHFQVGPSSDNDYRTFFHSAIRQSANGLGFGVCAIGSSDGGERWVRFDNFRVLKD